MTKLLTTEAPRHHCRGRAGHLSKQCRDRTLKPEIPCVPRLGSCSTRRRNGGDAVHGKPCGITLFPVLLRKQEPSYGSPLSRGYSSLRELNLDVHAGGEIELHQ